MLGRCVCGGGGTGFWYECSHPCNPTTTTTSTVEEPHLGVKKEKQKSFSQED